MRIGELRHRVTIQSETATPDDAGGYALAWTNIATVWTEVIPLSGREVYTAQHLEGRVTHRVTMRYQSGITTDMRLSMDSRVFNIRAVLNPDERNRWLDILVEEGAAV